VSILERAREVFGRKRGQEEVQKVEKDFFFATNTQLKEMLSRLISPELAAEGFSYDGGYVWFSPWEEHCRRVVRVYLLKGGAIFQWGLCFDFLPVPVGEWRSLRYQRTDKSVGLHLFTWPEGHWTSRPGPRPCRFSLFGGSPEEVETGILAAFYEARPAFQTWFRETAGLEGALAEARRQAAEPWGINWPRPEYALAFLLAMNGRAAEGAAALKAYLAQETERGKGVPPETAEKLREKLRACGKSEA